LFHLLTQTTNPLDIPSDSELVYRADFDKQWGAAIDKRNTVVIDATTIFPDYIRDVGRIRPVFSKNPKGNLVVFPATDAAPGSAGVPAR
jgi:hypothetical protein